MLESRLQERCRRVGGGRAKIARCNCAWRTAPSAMSASRAFAKYRRTPRPFVRVSRAVQSCDERERPTVVRSRHPFCSGYPHCTVRAKCSCHMESDDRCCSLSTLICDATSRPRKRPPDGSSDQAGERASCKWPSPWSSTSCSRISRMKRRCSSPCSPMPTRRPTAGGSPARRARASACGLVDPQRSDGVARATSSCRAHALVLRRPAQRHRLRRSRAAERDDAGGERTERHSPAAEWRRPGPRCWRSPMAAWAAATCRKQGLALRETRPRKTRAAAGPSRARGGTARRTCPKSGTGARRAG